MANEDLIKGLNEQMNREITTFLRYMVQAAAIRGAQNEAIRDMYLEEVMDEVGHAQYLANQISLLGGTPKPDPDLSPPPNDVMEMLRNDMEKEKDDVKHYTRLATLADEEGLMALKLRLEEQAADEGEHGQKMRRFLG